MRRPNLFIVGAPKCGTTALYTYLRRHPGIFMSPLKEPHFFGMDLRFRGRAPLSEPEYLACFAGARGQRLVGEASVWYLYSRRAAFEIKQFSPAAKIVVMLRNPVDVMYALHAERRFQGSENIADFEAALRAEPERRRGLDLPSRGMLDGGLYRAVARFPDQVARYFGAFGRENVHVIVFDDFQANTAAVYAATLAFLGVAPVVEDALRAENANRWPRSARLARILHEPPRVLQWFGRAVLSRPRRASLLARLRLLNSRVALRAPMPAELRRRLQTELRPDVTQLSAILGRDLTHWCGAEVVTPRSGAC